MFGMYEVPDLLRLNDLSVQSVAVDGADMAYVEKGIGKPVVFVHGAISDLRIWLDQVEYFSHLYRAVSYSRRAHWPNREGTKNEKYLRSSHARDLVGFLDALDLKRVHLVGHSFGGAVALLAALERPDLVSSLVLAEPSPFLGIFDESDMGKVLKQKNGFDEASLLLQRGKEEAAIRQFLTVIVGADVLDQLPETTRVAVLDNSSTLAPMLEYYFKSPPLAPEAFRAITTPTLLLSGEFSPKLGLLHNGKLRKCLPFAREAILFSTSHGLHIENPAGFAEVVLNFLAEVDSGNWGRRFDGFEQEKTKG